MRLLRMKTEYIEWTKNGWKVATTRLKMKPVGAEYELASGSWYKPKRSGVIIKITEMWSWTQKNIAYKFDMQEKILNAEDKQKVKFMRWQDFINELELINGKKIDMNEPLFTHFYEVVKP